MRWLDLFSGIGGFALGLRWAGFPPPVAFCERDPFCQRVLRKHWPDVPIFDDVRELDADAVGHVELVTGGFPCQPWSVAGQQRGADDDRDLWPAMRAVIAACRPRWVLGENVPGLVSHEMGLDRVLADLDALGYASQAFCIPACAIDAPHIRDRVWIVAHASGQPGQQDAGCSLGDEAPHGRAGRHLRKPNGYHGFAGRGEGGNMALGARPQERGGDVGDAEELGSPPWIGQPGRRSPPPEPQRSTAWSNAEWLWCEFDQRWRRVEPGVRLLAARVPQRVARLRALGNAVVPQVVEQIGRAILVELSLTTAP